MADKGRTAKILANFGVAPPHGARSGQRNG